MTKVLQLTAVIEREGDGYVATCPEVDVVSQGDTVEEARRNLVEAVEGFFETASLLEVGSRLGRSAEAWPWLQRYTPFLTVQSFALNRRPVWRRIRAYA